MPPPKKITLKTPPKIVDHYSKYKIGIYTLLCKEKFKLPLKFNQIPGYEGDAKV